jgi:hypothetical protein
MSAFVILQVPGSIRRTHPVDGVAASLVKSKKYLLPLAVLNPEITGGLIVSYLVYGRMNLSKELPVLDLREGGKDMTTNSISEVGTPSLEGAVGAPSSL